MFDGLKVLLVEDDPTVREGSEQALQLAGLDVLAFHSAELAYKLLTPDFPGIVVSDVRLPGMSGLELLQAVKTLDANLPVILVTGHGDITMAVHAMRTGAYDFIEKPYSSEQLVDVILRALETRRLTLEVHSLRRQLEDGGGIESRLLGNSVAMRDIRRLILDVANEPADVLIYGDTGTGKEMVARCLHDFSHRRKHNFVAVNCGAIPESIFESEVFGHEPGAFTGAAKRQVGKIEHADHGTFFLDEIESLPLSLQVKLLRVLQERAVRPVGSDQTRPIDVRLLSATHRDLDVAMAEGQFREDLYYRLNVVTLTLPPLAERREDIALLANHFLHKLAGKYQKPLNGFAPDALTALVSAPWPGNVRQLVNVVEQVCALATAPLVPLSLVQRALRVPSLEALSYNEAKQRFERDYLIQLLRLTDGNVADAARLADRNRTEFYRLLQKYELTPALFRGENDPVAE